MFFAGVNEMSPASQPVYEDQAYLQSQTGTTLLDKFTYCLLVKSSAEVSDNPRDNPFKVIFKKNILLIFLFYFYFLTFENDIEFLKGLYYPYIFIIHIYRQN